MLHFAHAVRELGRTQLLNPQPPYVEQCTFEPGVGTPPPASGFSDHPEGARRQLRLPVPYAPSPVKSLFVKRLSSVRAQNTLGQVQDRISKGDTRVEHTRRESYVIRPLAPQRALHQDHGTAFRDAVEHRCEIAVVEHRRPKVAQAR